MQTRRTTTINQQAWDDIAPQVRDIFRARQRELLERAKPNVTGKPGRPPLGERAMTGAERQRNQRHRRVAAKRLDDFAEFIDQAYQAGKFDRDPEVIMDLVIEFLANPTAATKLRLYTHLKARPWLLGDANLDRFS